MGTGHRVAGYHPAVRLDDIFAETRAIVGRNRAVLAVFTGGMAVGSSALSALIGDGQATAAEMAISIVTGYLLFWRLLDSEGLLGVERWTAGFFAYLFCSVVVGVVVLLAALVFVLPGLMLMARWSLVAPLVIARGVRLSEAFSQSWKQTRRTMWPIVGIYAFAGVAFFAALVPFGVYNALGKRLAGVGLTDVAVEFLSNIASYALSGVLSCSTVALFSLLVDRDERIFA